MGTSPNYNDEIDKILNIKPSKDYTSDIDRILGLQEKPAFCVTDTQWQRMTPGVKQSYQKNYNIEIVPVGKPQQVVPTQPEEQKPSLAGQVVGAIGKGIEWVDKPNRMRAQQIRTGYRAMLGVLPKVADVRDAFYDPNQRTPYFRNLINRGLMPTEAKILNEFGPEEGQKFIDDIKRTFKSIDPFSNENTRMSRGEMGSRTNSTNP